MPKKTFFKRLQMLEKCGFIKCHSTSHKKLGIECEVTDIFILKKAFEEIERILTLPPLTEDPLSDTLASITVTQLIFCDIIHGIILGSILEDEEKVRIWLLVALEYDLKTLNEVIRRLLHILPKVDVCKRYVIADILNEWSLLFIKRYFDFAKDLNLVCSSTAKELIKSKESSHKQLEK